MKRYRFGLSIVLLSGLLIGNFHLTPATAQPLVDAVWLARHLTDDHLVVLDIRNQIDGGSQAVYEAGHIPGAVYSNYLTAGWRVTKDGIPGMLPPIEHLEQLIGGLGISNQTHVVIIPGGVSALDYGSATRVYWTFKVIGHQAVSILNGGYAGWIKNADRPVETGINTPPATPFKAALQSQWLATRADVSRAVQSGVALIDNRPPAQFEGQQKHPAAKRFGALPHAANIPQDVFFNSDTGQFASQTELAQLWAQHGIAKDDIQITYCNTGHWASLGWFAASELLGHAKAALYDGSMTEWTAHDKLPMMHTTHPLRQ